MVLVVSHHQQIMDFLVVHLKVAHLQVAGHLETHGDTQTRAWDEHMEPKKLNSVTCVALHRNTKPVFGILVLYEMLNGEKGMCRRFQKKHIGFNVDCYCEDNIYIFVHLVEASIRSD